MGRPGHSRRLASGAVWVCGAEGRLSLGRLLVGTLNPRGGLEGLPGGGFIQPTPACRAGVSSLPICQR